MLINYIDKSHLPNFTSLSNLSSRSRFCFFGSLKERIPSNLKKKGYDLVNYLNNKHVRTHGDAAPYHYVIDSLGQIFEIRNPHTQPGRSAGASPEDVLIFVSEEEDYAMSEEQKNSLSEIVSHMSSQFGMMISNSIVSKGTFSEIGPAWDVLIQKTIIKRNSINGLFKFCEDVSLGNPYYITVEGPVNPDPPHEINITPLSPLIGYPILKIFSDEITHLRYFSDYTLTKNSNGDFNKITLLTPVEEGSFLQIEVPTTKRELTVRQDIVPWKILPYESEFQKLANSMGIDIEVLTNKNPHVSSGGPDSSGIIFIPRNSTVEYDSVFWGKVKDCETIRNEVRPYL